MIKTNVMRLLDASNINYTTKNYEYSEEDLSGKHVANVLGLDYSAVFKTLVTKGDKTGILTFCIPVDKDLDLKKSALVSGNKKIEMIHLKELLPLTGYIRGGCSPIGMKKKYSTYIDETALKNEMISISAGVRGIQLLIDPKDLIKFLSAKPYLLTK